MQHGWFLALRTGNHFVVDDARGAVGSVSEEKRLHERKLPRWVRKNLRSPHRANGLQDRQKPTGNLDTCRSNGLIEIIADDAPALSTTRFRTGGQARDLAAHVDRLNAHAVTTSDLRDEPQVSIAE
jgi:hypothetical protein